MDQNHSDGVAKLKRHIYSSHLYTKRVKSLCSQNYMNNSVSIFIHKKSISQNVHIPPPSFKLSFFGIKSVSSNLMVFVRVIKDVQGQSTTMELQKCDMDLFKLLSNILYIPVTIIVLSIIKHHSGRLSCIRINHPSMAR